MGEKRKILLIDDDAGIRKVMAIALKDAGYSVITAPDGETGIELCRKESPHIVITDIGMPGIDGLEVVKRIKHIDPDKEVIVITAFSDIDLAIKAMQLDTTAFVIKPVDHESLAVALQRAEERYARRKDMMNYTTLMEQRWMDTAEELAKMFHFQRMLIESSIDGIMACDIRGKVVIFNRSMEEMLGYKRAEVIGKMSLLQFFTPGEAGRFQDELYSEENSRESRLYPFESELVDRYGKRVPVLLSATVLFQQEEPIGLVVYFRGLADGG